MVKETGWVKRAHHLFERYVDDNGEIIDPSFKEHIEYLRSCDDITEGHHPRNLFPPKLYTFMWHFNFPNGMRDFLHTFIKDEKIDYSLVRPDLYLISESTRSGRSSESEETDSEGWQAYQDSFLNPDLDRDDIQELKLIISPEASITDIVAFIRQHKNFIEAQQGKLSARRTRVRSYQNRKRDLYIQKLVEEGLTYKKVADQLNSEQWGAPLAAADIATIMSRLRKSRSTT